MSAVTLTKQDGAFVSSRILAHLPALSGVNIILDERFSKQRLSVESYIHDKFEEQFGADIQHFLPYLLSLKCNDNFCATVGIRTAESEPLFLENYLRYPIEQEIGNYFKTAIDRESIVEIGNLVSTWRGSSQLLFIILTDLLLRLDREWVVFTATKEVEFLLKKMNFNPVHLADASLKMLSDDKERWGSYYDGNPKVMFGHAPSAMSILKQSTILSSPLSLFSNSLSEIVDNWNVRK